ncbi:hypothetical protein DRO33_01290 [Candidatus Bathyarchaeota archaeon]|nr:MAG: hypothetical protein DRO33_01290 [Candidatus Bathyarchaeota archaeon]
MRIKSVRLKNIRSHVDTYVEFEEGFNCLIGGLGAGKTSILYAIDFALFGERLGRSYAYLLREGADRGTVTLRFTHEGSEYVLTRGLRRAGTGIVQDPSVLELRKDGRLIAHKRASAVAEQLAKELGLDKELFREVIWVRQEKLKEILDMRPADRQKKLDELLGLEEFEEARSKLASFERYYKGVLDTYRRDPDIIAAQRLEEEHAQLVEKLASISAEIEDVKLEIDKASKDVEEALAKLTELEEARKRQEKIRAKKLELEAAVREAERAVKRLSAEVERRREAIKELEAQLESLVAKEMEHRRAFALSGLETGASVEEAKKLLAEWESRMAELRELAARARQEIESKEESLKIISSEARCPTCLRFIDETYRREMTARLKREIVKLQHELEEAKAELSRLEELRSKLSRAVDALMVIEARKSDLKARLEDEREALEQAERDLDSTKMRLEMLRVELEALESELTGPSEEEVEAARAELDACRKRLSELEGRLRELQARRDMVKERIADCERRLSLVEEKRARMEKAAKVLELIKLLRSAYKAVRPHLRSEVVKLARYYVQRVLDELLGPEGAGMVVEIGQDYTPIVKVGGRERSVAHLSGGERTLLALAYRIGMGHLIMQYRTGRGLDLLLLDEPTESLGREDLSIDRLADALSRLRVVRQIIAVSHSEAFAERADKVIRIEKVDNESRVRTESRP